MANFSDFQIDTRGAAAGEIKTTCPKCSPHRRKAGYPCLNVNVERGVWHCWHCDWSGSLKRGEETRPEIRREWKKPTTRLQGLSDWWLAWLHARGISDAVAARFRLSNGMIYMPQLEAEVDAIVWPYFRGGELVNCKYRDRDKNFRMAAGAQRVLYGLDEIENTRLVWVEGEMDRLSVEEAGIGSCVSVPDGAPAITAKNYSTKFDYIDAAADRLALVRKHILAVDADAPGQRLQEELIRRLGVEKCHVVTWPEGCKDANDVLVKHGAEILRQLIEAARPCPVAGVFSVADVADSVRADYEQGVLAGKSTGWPVVDALYTVREGEWTVVTGIPGSGKSEWLDALMVNLADLHGWRFAVCSPENQPIQQHVEKLLEKVTGKPFNLGPSGRMSPDDREWAMSWVGDRVHFVLPERPTIAEILEKTAVLVGRYGIKGLIVDPWNELETSRPSGMSETEHISHSLTTFRQFARRHGVHVWLVAHPAKLTKGLDGKYPVPTPYDISGSAHWRNKADNAITIHREIGGSAEVQVHVQKIRFKVVGRVGACKLKYDIVSGRYSDEGVTF
jgi:twinkle protein